MNAEVLTLATFPYHKQQVDKSTLCWQLRLIRHHKTVEDCLSTSQQLTKHAEMWRCVLYSRPLDICLRPVPIVFTTHGNINVLLHHVVHNGLYGKRFGFVKSSDVLLPNV